MDDCYLQPGRGRSGADLVIEASLRSGDIQAPDCGDTGVGGIVVTGQGQASIMAVGRLFA
jgi:hypothetical protein